MDLFFNNFFSWIEKKSARKNYPVYLTLLLVGISLFFAFPRFDLYNNTASIWDVTMLKANDLTNNLSHIDPDSYLAKKVFRLSVPLVVKLFHLNRIGILAIQFVLGYLLILYSYKLTNRILKDPVSATFLATGVAFLYCGRTCFTEISYTWFDGWGYFFLLMTLYNKNIFSVFLFASLAAWTDERAFIALPFAILFHQMNRDRPAKFEFKGLRALSAASFSVIAAMAGYISLRLFLSSAYNMHTPKGDANFAVFKDNFIHTSFGFGTYTFLEGFWLLFPILIYFGLKNRHYLLTGLISAQMAISTMVALSVYDITRSGSYSFAVLFILVLYISKYIDPKYLRICLMGCMFFSFIFPPVNYVAFSHGGFEFQIEKPFFWVLYNLIT